MEEEIASCDDGSISEIGEDLRSAIEQLQSIPALIWKGGGGPHTSFCDSEVSSAIIPTELRSTGRRSYGSVSYGKGSCGTGSYGSDTVFYDDSVAGVDANKNSTFDSRLKFTSSPYSSRLSEDLRFSSQSTTSSFSQDTHTTLGVPGANLSLEDSDIISLTNSLNRAIKDNFPVQDVLSGGLRNSSETFAAAPHNISYNLDFKVRKIHKHAVPRNLVHVTPFADVASDQISLKRSQRDVYEEAMNILDSESVRTKSQSRSIRCESPESLVERILDGIGLNDLATDELSFITSASSQCAFTSDTNANPLCNGSSSVVINEPGEANESGIPLTLYIVSENVGHQTLGKDETLATSDCLLQGEDTPKLLCDTVASAHRVRLHQLNALSENLKYPSTTINDSLRHSATALSSRTIDSDKGVGNQHVHRTRTMALRASRIERQKSPEEIFEEIVESLRDDSDSNDTSYLTDPPCYSWSTDVQKHTGHIVEQFAEQNRKQIKQQQPQYECEIRNYAIENEQHAFYYGQARVEKTPVMKQVESVPRAIVKEVQDPNDFVLEQNLCSPYKPSHSVIQCNNVHHAREDSKIIRGFQDKECSGEQKKFSHPIKSCDTESSEPDGSGQPSSSCTHNGSCELIYTNEPICLPTPIIISRLEGFAKPLNSDKVVVCGKLSAPKTWSQTMDFIENIVDGSQDSDGQANIRSEVPVKGKGYNEAHDSGKPKVPCKKNVTNRLKVSRISSRPNASNSRPNDPTSRPNDSVRETLTETLTSFQQEGSSKLKNTVRHEIFSGHEASSSCQTTDLKGSSRKNKISQNYAAHSPEHAGIQEFIVTNNLKDLKKSNDSFRIHSDTSNDGLNLNIDKEFLRNVDACTNSDIDGGSLENLLSQNDDAVLRSTESKRMTSNQVRRRVQCTSRLCQSSVETETIKSLNSHLETRTTSKKINNTAVNKSEDGLHVMTTALVKKHSNFNSETFTLVKPTDYVIPTDYVNPTDYIDSLFRTNSDPLSTSIFPIVSEKVLNVPKFDQVTTEVKEDLNSKLNSNANEQFAQNLEMMLEDLGKQERLVSVDDLSRLNLLVANRSLSQSVDMNTACGNSISSKNVHFKNHSYDQYERLSSLKSEVSNSFIDQLKSENVQKVTPDSILSDISDQADTVQRKDYDEILESDNAKISTTQHSSLHLLESIKENNVGALDCFHDSLDSSKVNIPTFDSAKVNMPIFDSAKVNIPTLDSSKVNMPIFDSAKVNIPALDSSKVRVPALDSSKVNIPTLNNSATLETVIVKTNDSDKKIPSSKSSIIPSVQVLSEEVITQEIVLNIAWPGGKKGPHSKRRRIPKTLKTDAGVFDRKPFREFQLQRLIKMSDWDVDEFQMMESTLSSGTGQDRTLSIEDKYFCRNMIPDNEQCAVSLVRHDGRRYPEEKCKSGKVYANKSRTCDVIDTTSVMDVLRDERVRVIRVPGDAIYRVPSLKHVVEAVSQTVLEDTQLLCADSNIRVVCEARECRSKPLGNTGEQGVPDIQNEPYGQGDSNLIVIRREIYDKNSMRTLPKILLPSGERNVNE